MTRTHMVDTGSPVVEARSAGDSFVTTRAFEVLARAGFVVRGESTFWSWHPDARLERRRRARNIGKFVTRQALVWTYVPLARPLYIYVKRSSLARPEVRKFVEYYLDNVVSLARTSGYVAPSEADRAANTATLAEAIRLSATPGR